MSSDLTGVQEKNLKNERCRVTKNRAGQNMLSNYDNNYQRLNSLRSLNSANVAFGQHAQGFSVVTRIGEHLHDWNSYFNPALVAVLVLGFTWLQWQIR